jgi:hypothetical protein
LPPSSRPLITASIIGVYIQIIFDEQLLRGVYYPILKAEIMPKHSGSRIFIISRISAAGYPKFSQDN